MRSRSVVLVTEALVLCALVLGPADADPQSWTVSISTDELRFSSFGTRPGALDGRDQWDYVGQYPQLTGFYRPEWGGWTGFWAADIRSPLAAGESKTWSDIYFVWFSGADYTPRRVYVSRSADPQYGPPQWWTVDLYLDEVPAGIVYDGPYHWQFGSGLGWIELPLYVYSEPLGNPQGYRFHITVTATVPEPASALVLLAGLAAVFLRRRG